MVGTSDVLGIGEDVVCDCGSPLEKALGVSMCLPCYQSCEPIVKVGDIVEFDAIDPPLVRGEVTAIYDDLLVIAEGDTEWRVSRMRLKKVY